jgi:hypothetical protein
MRQLPWIMLFGLLVVACVKNHQPDVLDVSKEPKEYKVRPAQDPIVKVSGPSIVYVKQNKKTRVLIQWLPERAGQVTVPLRAVDDGSGPLIVGVKPIVEEPDKEQYGTPDGPDCLCSECMNAGYTCCTIMKDEESSN